MLGFGLPGAWIFALVTLISPTWSVRSSSHFRPGMEDTFDLDDDRSMEPPEATFPARASARPDRGPSIAVASHASPLSASPLSTSSVCAVEGAGRRVVSVADQHGDFDGLLMHLQLLGLANSSAGRDKSTWGNLWAGGDAIMVQTGDILDRGPDGKLMYEFLWALQDSAQASTPPGEVVLLIGNHELMVLQGDIRYVTDVDFCKYTKDNCGGSPPKEASYCSRSTSCCTYENQGCSTGMQCFEGMCEFLDSWDLRGAMGSEMRRRFSEGKMQLVYRVNGIIFTHAGLVSSLWPKVAKKGVDLVDSLNAEAVKLLTENNGSSLRASDHVVAAGSSQGGPVWTRVCYDYWYTRTGRRRRNGDKKPYYMDEDEFERVENGRCATVAASLAEISVKRMVIGHCPQDPWPTPEGVQTSCSGSLVMTDTYMSIAYCETRDNAIENMAALEFYSEDTSGRVWTVYAGRSSRCEELPPTA